MTVADFAKFYDFILRGGTAPNGARLLTEASVRLLTHGSFGGLDRSGPVATIVDSTGVAGSRSFNYGWAKSTTGFVSTTMRCWLPTCLHTYLPADMPPRHV